MRHPARTPPDHENAAQPVRPHQTQPPKKQGRELRLKFCFEKKRSSGPTPLRQIRGQQRKHKQPKHSQTENHHHHRLTPQTPLSRASLLPFSSPSFTSTYLLLHPTSVPTARHFCHPVHTPFTAVLELFSHYPPALFPPLLSDLCVLPHRTLR